MAKTKAPKTAKPKAPVQKQRANVYTMMLIVSLLFLSLGSFLMYKELERYKFEYEVPKQAKKPAIAALFVPTTYGDCPNFAQQNQGLSPSQCQNS